MKAAINALNWLNDLDSGWWPFLFLRPAKDQKMSFMQVLKISSSFGLIYGAFAGIIACMNEGFLLERFMLPLLLGPPLFLVFWGSLFAPAWNSRAKELQKTKSPQPPKLTIV